MGSYARDFFGAPSAFGIAAPYNLPAKTARGAPSVPMTKAEANDIFTAIDRAGLNEDYEIARHKRAEGPAVGLHSRPNVFRRGAFAKMLAKIAAGEWVVKLLLDHDPDLSLPATTANGGLELSDTPVGLSARLSCPASLASARYLRDHWGAVDMSIGDVSLLFSPDTLLDGTEVVAISEALILEVSLVREGNFPQTRLLILG